MHTSIWPNEHKNKTIDYLHSVALLYSWMSCHRATLHLDQLLLTVANWPGFDALHVICEPSHKSANNRCLRHTLTLSSFSFSGIFGDWSAAFDISKTIRSLHIVSFEMQSISNLIWFHCQALNSFQSSLCCHFYEPALFHKTNKVGCGISVFYKHICI